MIEVIDYEVTTVFHSSIIYDANLGVVAGVTKSGQELLTAQLGTLAAVFEMLVWSPHCLVP